MDKREIMTQLIATRCYGLKVASHEADEIIEATPECDDSPPPILKMRPPEEVVKVLTAGTPAAECDDNASTFTDGGTSYGKPPLAADVEFEFDTIETHFKYVDEMPDVTDPPCTKDPRESLSTIRAALEAKRAEVPIAVLMYLSNEDKNVSLPRFVKDWVDESFGAQEAGE